MADVKTTVPGNFSNVNENTSVDYLGSTPAKDYHGYDDEYFYDYEDAINTIPLGEVIPVALVYGLTLVLGVTGNSLVIFSIGRYKPMRSITNIFLLSLASADLLLVCICVPVKCIAFFTFTWDLGLFMCKFVHYMQNVSMICSVMTLTVMSVERFIAILFPLQAKSLCTPKHAVFLCILIWCLSFILAIPILFGQTEVEVGVIRKGLWCMKRWEKPLYDKLYEMYMLILLFIIPVVIMVLAYAGICRELWIVTSHRAQLRASSDVHTMYYQPAGHTVAPVARSYFAKQKVKKVSKEDDNTRRQVIQMLVVVVVLFAVCWGPILINNVLAAWGVVHKLHYEYLKPMRQAFFLMSYLNSCVNPIVYGFMSKNFRERFRHAICRACGRRNWLSRWCRKWKRDRGNRPSRLTGTMSMSRTMSMKTDFETDQTDYLSETIRPIAPFENSSETT